MNLITQSSSLTMSSHEIAELVSARHNDVFDTVERLFEKGILRESRKNTREHRTGGRGRPTMVYDLTKRDTLVVASGYNDEMRARIIDRWQELETGNAAPVRLPSSPVNDILLVSDAISRIPGVNPGIAMSLALDAIESHTGLPVTIMRKALPGISAADAVKMNAGELGGRFGMSLDQSIRSSPNSACKPRMAKTGS